MRLAQNSRGKLLEVAAGDTEFFGEKALASFGHHEMNFCHAGIFGQQLQGFLREQSTAGAGHTESNDLSLVLVHDVVQRIPVSQCEKAKSRTARRARVIEFAATIELMDARELLNILELVKAKKLSPDDALGRVKHLPFEDLDFAKVDHHRALRQGFAEVVFAKGKTPGQVAEIVKAMLRKKHSRQNVLITRADPKVFGAVRRLTKNAKFHLLSGVITIERNGETKGKGTIAVVSAGTSDIPVAEEALLTARIMGNRVEHLYDVGVAGIHRLLQHKDKLVHARVIICVAGMEGALPSVVGGLVSVPVIAVPTSVGYGASFGGVAALLGMLNSCASNVTVVNIDNGFGAACVASCINRL